MTFLGGNNDDEEVEVALVCAKTSLDEVNNIQFIHDEKNFNENKKEKNEPLWKRFQRQFVSETFQCVGALFILIVVLGLIVLSFFYCQICLFGIMVFSACMCPYISYFNIPLWTSILLIVILGMAYTNRPFTFIWK
jgi:magnesium-transporting ATPase (P-type)